MLALQAPQQGQPLGLWKRRQWYAYFTQQSMKLSVQQFAHRLFMTAVPLLGESAHVVISGKAA